MWDQDDYVGRWVQGVCAFLLAWFALGGIYMLLYHGFLLLYFAGLPVVIASIRLCWRCARYAFTGQGNVNREDY